MMTSILGLIVLAADIYAFVNIAQSGLPTGNKVLWCLLIFFLPLLGFIIWAAAGPRD